MWRCACVLALLCTALLRCSAHKRAEMSPVPFVLSSRYGRSPPLAHSMMTRSDRFFITSRYGKRSEGDSAGIGDAGGTIWRGGCNCAHYARHPPTSAFYKRRVGEPEQVPAED